MTGARVESAERTEARRAAAAAFAARRAAASPERAAMETARAAVAAGRRTRRLWTCRYCEQFNGAVCLATYPQGCCRVRWETWITAAASRCPAAPPKWEAET